uniref:Uncharacterized protein n=1 Tax=Rhizophora mucronata TaxID=61149 RepID=A0A2P2IYY6_RHIMU
MQADLLLTLPFQSLSFHLSKHFPFSQRLPTKVPKGKHLITTQSYCNQVNKEKYHNFFFKEKGEKKGNVTIMSNIPLVCLGWVESNIPQVKGSGTGVCVIERGEQGIETKTL